ncbi:MAG: sensor histidine kinase, partial [Parapedobacter sp.]
FQGDIANIFAEGRIGLSNTAKRLFYHFGEQLTVEQNSYGGLQVSFQIPH